MHVRVFFYFFYFFLVTGFLVELEAIVIWGSGFFCERHGAWWW